MTVGYLSKLAERARKYYEDLGETVKSVDIRAGTYPTCIAIECEDGITYIHTIEAFEQL